MAENKYQRKTQLIPGKTMPQIDVYCVLDAFQVACPARQHAIKKLLCAGIRGKGDYRQDLREALDSVQRAIEMQENRERATTTPELEADDFTSRWAKSREAEEEPPIDLPEISKEEKEELCREVREKHEGPAITPYDRGW